MSHRFRKSRGLFDLVDVPPRTDALYCRECTTDVFLKEIIEEPQMRGVCTACGNDERGVYSATIIARVAAKHIIPRFFDVQTVDNDNPKRLRTLEQVLSEVTGIENEKLCEMMAAEVRSMQAPAESTSPVKLYLRRHTALEREKDKRAFVLDRWDRISASILHGQRYYNAAVTKFFELLFDEAQLAQSHSLFGNYPSATKEHSAGFRLYRARRLDSETDRDKISKSAEFAERELGAPPKKVAAQNRMNARGIPLFYGAEDRDTCIAEVRPSIGDTVAVGLFETTRPIRFFDFRNFKNFRAPTKLSYWNEDYEERQICRELLLHLSEVIAKPVREGETGYITTQAMVEFIRHKLAGDFGGVIFSSVQHADGTNFVVFSDSEVSALLDDLAHEPTFPVKLHNGPQFFHIDAVAYTSKPLQVGSSASV